MSTLKIKIYYYEVELRIKGISFKKLYGSSVGHSIIRSDGGFYALECERRISSTTAQVTTEYLIKSLAELKIHIPFDNIKILNNYELTGTELMRKVEELYERNQYRINQ